MPSRGTSADEFSQAVSNYAKRTVQLIAKDVASAVFAQTAELIIKATPVLTGHARHNWVPSIDSPANSEIGGVAGVDATGAALTGEEVNGLNSVLKQFRDGNGTKLFLTNNAPYIGNLDAGSSAKAPAGIVEPSIQASLAVLKDKKLNV